MFSNRERLDHHKHPVSDGPKHGIRRYRGGGVVVTRSVVEYQDVIIRGHRVVVHGGLHPIGRLTRGWIRWVAGWQALNDHAIDDDPPSTDECIESVVRHHTELRL